MAEDQRAMTENFRGSMIPIQAQHREDEATALSALALLRDLPEHGLVRGQVGTILEALDEATALVEFSDDEGRAYAVVPCRDDALLVLRTVPRAA
ncbi:uncharacterized protein DUF4926 [Roseiarcus fermentans]|uniref:Uncharacterized protein DUF4926 n=1 Tax=Roseiarcus fermentans TaxID=1473586 RepID=A0A366FGR5_9HYPH|nr:DUF4926 domain-containing protein [Roseiarcus fermentans]RBP13848.1 uncharacterized protein DUF4926 [Roseiarcus fermentans]